MDTTVPSGPSMSTVRTQTPRCTTRFPTADCDDCVPPSATSTLLVSGSADNMLKLWNVRTGECLYTWEFPTAVKRVAWSEDDSKILAVTEKRMGYPGGVAVFAINREDPKQRPSSPFVPPNPGFCR